jgi:hypothetical protein
MANDALPRFAHRTRYETVDSICTKCFQTIGNASSESELMKQESAHIQKCQGLNFGDLMDPGAKEPRTRPIQVGASRSDQSSQQ